MSDGNESTKTHVIGKNIRKNERLLEFEAQIKAEGANESFVTSNKNGSVSVPVRTTDNSTSCVTGHDFQELETIVAQALKKSFGGNKKFC